MPNSSTRLNTGMIIFKAQVGDSAGRISARGFVALNRAVLDLVSLGLILSDNGGFRPGGDAGAHKALLLLQGDISIPSAPSYQAGWLESFSLGSDQGVESDHSDLMSVIYSVQTPSMQVKIHYRTHGQAVREAGWVFRTKSVSYGSPFVQFLEAAIPVAAASSITGLVSYISGGRAARRKLRAEADLASTTARLAEKQQEAVISETEAQARLANAEARLKELEASKLESQTDRQLKEVTPDDIDLWELGRAYRHLRAYCDSLSTPWTEADIGRFLTSTPGLAAAVLFAESSDLEVTIEE